MPDVQYPYMPPDRYLKYVPVDSPFMVEAAKAREELAGDPLWPVGIVAVHDGVVVARAGNGFNRGHQDNHVCPRIVLECKSGEGYELCAVHDPPGHSEPMLVKACRDAGVDTQGLDAYMYGHWWACEPCWKALIDAGFRDLYVTDDAHERFTKDKVYGETLKSSVKSAYIAGTLTSHPDLAAAHRFYEQIGEACREIGCEPVIPHVHHPLAGGEMTPRDVFDWACAQSRGTDAMVADVSSPSHGVGGELTVAQAAGRPIVLLSRKGTKVSRFVLGNPGIVYHIEYETEEQACRMLKQVLKQL